MKQNSVERIMDKTLRKRNASDRIYDIVIVLVLLAISTLLRLYNYKEQAVLPDELIYSRYTFSILANNWAWIPEFMSAQPPLVPYMLAVVARLFGGGLDILRIVPILFGSLTVCVIYFLGKLLYNRWVGLLSAIILCFSIFHILYSRTLMLEVIVIFFMFASMYFFLKSYNEKNNIKFAFASGIFLGLAYDTKYVGFILYVSYILFLLWINKKGWFTLGWKFLVERRFLILTIVSLVLFLPVFINTYVLNGINPFYFHLISRFFRPKVYFVTAEEWGIFNLIKHGFDKYVTMLTGENVVVSPLPWLPIFHIAALVLFVVTIFYFVYIFLKSKPSVVFLTIFFITINIFVAIYRARFQYYLLWGLPAFFIMLSYMIVDFIRDISSKLEKKEYKFSLMDIGKAFILSLAFIFVFSYIVSGVLAPTSIQLAKGAYEELVGKIKLISDPGDLIVTSDVELTWYYLDKYNMSIHNYPVLPITRAVPYAGKKKIIINLELIDTLKPRFLIVETSILAVSVHDYMYILKNYRLITMRNDIYLFERKL